MLRGQLDMEEALFHSMHNLICCKIGGWKPSMSLLCTACAAAYSMSSFVGCKSSTMWDALIAKQLLADRQPYHSESQEIPGVYM
jgi:hypothetical protein